MREIIEATDMDEAYKLVREQHRMRMRSFAGGTANAQLLTLSEMLGALHIGMTSLTNAVSVPGHGLSSVHDRMVDVAHIALLALASIKKP
jgi:hypothetical protein